ncbi:hypothetical protein GF324_01985, partial [bacterium]|nr:hypothetical protein [bacterium]
MRRTISTRHLPTICLPVAGLLMLIYHAVGRSAGMPFMLTLDDSYIHLTLARNLAETGVLGLNPGEGGGGSSSAAWTFLLTLFYKFGAKLDVTAWGMSAVFGLLSGWAAGRLARVVLEGWYAWAAGLAMAMSGMMIANALTGMETTAALFFFLVALERSVSGSPVAAALLFAVGSLFRPELALGFLPLAWQAWRQPIDDTMQRKLQGGAIFIGLPLVAAAGVLLLVWVSNGFPSTFAGRQWLAGMPQHPLQEFGLYLAAVGNGLQQYLVRISSFIGPAHGFGLIWGTIVLLLSAWGLWRLWIKGNGYRTIIGLSILPTLFFLLFLPTTGQMGRYHLISWMLLPLTTVLGIREASSFKHSTTVKRVLPWAALFLAAGYIPQAIRWGGWHHDTAHHLATVHLSMAHTVKGHVEPDDPVAAFDIGLLSWQSGCRVIDLGGLTGGDMVEAMYERRVAERLVKRNVPYIILPEMWQGDPQRFQFAERLGLSTADLQPLERRELD